MSTDLKQAFEADLNALKNLEIEILPANQYYRALFSRLGMMYALFIGFQLLACLIAMYTGAWDDPWSNTPERIKIAKMSLGVLLSSAFFMLFMIGKVRSYVLFKYQMERFLQSGTYLSHKMRQALQLYFAIFSGLSFLCIAIFNQDMTFFAGIAAFIASGVLISIAIEMEASRIGLTVLVTAIRDMLALKRTR